MCIRNRIDSSPPALGVSDAPNLGRVLLGVDTTRARSPNMSQERAFRRVLSIGTCRIGLLDTHGGEVQPWRPFRSAGYRSPVITDSEANVGPLGFRGAKSGTKTGEFLVDGVARVGTRSIGMQWGLE